MHSMHNVSSVRARNPKSEIRSLKSLRQGTVLATPSYSKLVAFSTGVARLLLYHVQQKDW